MGLDAYIMKVPGSFIPDGEIVDFQISFQNDGYVIPKQLMYWRKFWILHNWMAALYKDKGGSSSDFNGKKLLLTLKDAYAWKSDVENKTMRNSDGTLLMSNDFWMWDQMEKDADTLIWQMQNPHRIKFYYYSSY